MGILESKIKWGRGGGGGADRDDREGFGERLVGHA